MNWKIVAVFVVVSAAAAFAQEVPGAEGPTTGPPLGDGPRDVAMLAAKLAHRAVAPSRRVVLAPLDVAPLLEEDARYASMPALHVDPRVAVTRRMYTLYAPRRLVAGARGVETMPDGSLTWTAEVAAPGASGLRLHVSRCGLPDGATLVVENAADPTEAYGPFTGAGPKGTGEFLLPTVFGDTARVEIRVPAARAGAPLAFSIDRLAHRYRERGAGHEEPRVGTKSLKATSCENDVASDSSYVQDVARAVATMEIYASDGNVYLCSGALLNDSDAATNIPYFLTAHHCMSSEYDANNTEFYFDYRAATAGGKAPPLSTVPRVSGATLLATSASSDYTLVKLTGTMPSNRFFCGWSAAAQPIGESIVGVHHPEGRQMSISYGTLLVPDGSFHQVQWTSGITEPGSSGSPLFNQQKQVIGQLYGGSSSCSQRDGIDEYGRFDRTYTALQSWLGAGGASSTGDGWDPSDDVLSGASLLVPDFAGSTHGSHSLSKSDPTDWFAFDLFAGGRYRFFSTGVDDVKAVLYSNVLATNVVASDDDSGGTKQFSIDFAPTTTGRYYLLVTPTVAQTSVDYTLNYIEVNTAKTKAAPAVAALGRSIAVTSLHLKWRDVSHTESGYYVDLSDDVGANWRRVAELPRNSTSYTSNAPPGRHLYRVGAWNASGTIKWRTIAVTITDPNQLDAWDTADDVGAGATLLAPASGGTSETHTLSRADAGDWFKIVLTGGGRYVFQTSGTLDTYGEIFDDPSGNSLETADDNGGPGANFRISFIAPQTATYWLKVSPAVQGDIGSYAVTWKQK